MYLKTGATDEEIEQVGKDILQIDGVRDAKYISNTEGLESRRETLGDKMIEGYTTDNILPASYEVTLTDLELSSDVQESLKQIPNVDDIRSSNIIIEQINKISQRNKNCYMGNFSIINNNFYCNNIKYNKINSTCKKKRNINNEICWSYK